VFARSYAAWHLGERDELFERVRARLSLEGLLLAGCAILLAGIVAGLVVLFNWVQADFGRLELQYLFIVALGVGVIGIQVLFGAFFLSVLGLGRRAVAEHLPMTSASRAVDGKPVRRLGRNRA
jgi:hypothetical protein